ncbi:hypothetical protein LshimejAT787_0806220 [Lyophyllum shimeji]|uniref:SMODS and SLOG-associating 2TM effector domain-containing protein n=1 Tax=Lyophyllum shimeji TaxID=47721 RepID=A0A9P3US23_LYOSH|nr:hypothetical protein LshimejAT787_0806220 [Lyophyllum shimeji]
MDKNGSSERDHASTQPTQQQTQAPSQQQQQAPPQQPGRPQPAPLNTAGLMPPQPFSYTAPSAPPQIVSPTRSDEKPADDAALAPETRRDNGFGRDRDRLGNPLPPVPGDARLGSDVRPPTRARTVDTHHSVRPMSMIDHVVPVEEKPHPRRTVAERLEPTLATAIIERDKYAMKARTTGIALNAAIGLQVLLGSLTTGLSAAATTGRQAAVATTVLGGLSTLVASYLARARGSNEPELSITRVKDLEQFIRECQAFIMDNGHVLTGEYDAELFRFRSRFEELLGNASGERKLSPPV